MSNGNNVNMGAAAGSSLIISLFSWRFRSSSSICCLFCNRTSCRVFRR